MPHHIPNPIVLDLALGKCEPRVHYCDKRSSCATHLVSSQGRSTGDYTSLVNGWKSSSCAGYRDVTKHRPDPEKAGPKVHDTPKGLL